LSDGDDAALLIKDNRATTGGSRIQGEDVRHEIVPTMR
jgi:hypothetical protein